MRILVPIKQVADPDHSARIRISADSTALDESSLERKLNPFDEYALETALRLTEDARNSRQRLGEVIVVTLGTKTTEVMLRSAMATGADRAIRIESRDDELDGRLVGKALASLARRLEVDLVLLGKQTVDGDGDEVAQRLAGLLDWPQSTFTSKIQEVEAGRLEVEREIDGGLQRLTLTLPAVISVELRIVSSLQVHSRHTPTEHPSPPGVRFASLPSIMQSKRKPLECLEQGELTDQASPQLRFVRYHPPAPRKPGRKVSSVDELARVLRTEAKVL